MKGRGGAAGVGGDKGGNEAVPALFALPVLEDAGSGSVSGSGGAGGRGLGGRKLQAAKIG